jgi:hypothetical protein
LCLSGILGLFHCKFDSWIFVDVSVARMLMVFN